MVALSELWLLHGFLPKNQLTQRLKNMPEFVGLISVYEEEGYFGLYKRVTEQSVVESNQFLQPLIDRILPLYRLGKLDKLSPDFWAAKAVDSAVDTTFLDKGIYSIYFFNIIKANKGEVVFQDAGISHTYLEGQNMELMSNSDNVLRGDLTHKHVDVPELLKHMHFEETIPTILFGEIQKDGSERIYKCPVSDFELSQIALEMTDLYKTKSKSAQILIVIEGEVVIAEGDSKLILGKGESTFLIAESEYKISSPSYAIIYKATTT